MTMAAGYQATRAGWTVQEWIETVPVKQSTLYNLWKKGEGPRRVRVGGRTIICESGADYLARMGKGDA